MSDDKLLNVRYKKDHYIDGWPIVDTYNNNRIIEKDECIFLLNQLEKFMKINQRTQREEG